MNHFLFITHVTPQAKRSPLRRKLFELYRTALISQTYGEWKVIQFCADEERDDDARFNCFHLADGTREEKEREIVRLYATQEVQSLIDWSDYVVKLDDDDLISPLILNELKNFTGDLYYDRFHTFIDSSSGSITQQERQWVASTCVHKTEHILQPWTGAGATPIGNLLYTDHSKAWHEYYDGKKTEVAPKEHPVYARILSPSSITSGANADSVQDLSKYDQYLTSFGNWKQAATHDFDAYLPAIAQAWQTCMGGAQRKLPSMGGGGALSGFANSVKRILKGKP